VAITNAHIYAKKVASYAHTILRAYRCFLRAYRILRAYWCRILRAYEKITHLSCRRKNELMQMNTQCLSCCLVLSFFDLYWESVTAAMLWLCMVG